ASVGALLRDSGLPALEARALLAGVLDCPRERLVAHPEAAVPAAARARFEALAARRRAGEPLAYLTGTREFYGREFIVGPAVLVPRPETELLVQQGLQFITQRRAPRVLDLGTGSGCIAITLALERPDAQVHAVERSPAARALAALNATRLAAAVDLRAGDWYEGAAAGYDLIVANPPYVAADDPHLAALAHEPTEALVGGADGLQDLRCISAGAPAHLQSGGWLAVEHGHDQAGAVQALLRQAGLEAVRSERDLQGIERVTCGRWAAAGAPTP
ncbi:MAG: peptide chain release factor N(5)-glutamine methyltransferase, partial [Betaproteobacteria bacterium]